VTVDIDLGGGRGSSLNAYVTQAKLRVQKIIVQHSLRPPSERPSGPILTVEELHAAASLQATQNANQPRPETMLANDLLNDMLFAMGPLNTQVSRPLLFREGFRVQDRLLGFPFQKREKVLASHTENLIQKR
jgi:hypothetical protein